jgi:hypothetical protein
MWFFLDFIDTNTTCCFKLCLIRESASGIAKSASDYTLGDLQKILERYGPDHFDPHRTNPWNYIILLLLTLQFEQVVNQLYSSKYQIEAVHLAIGLASHRMLRTTTDTQKQKGSLCKETIHMGETMFVNKPFNVITYSGCGRQWRTCAQLCTPDSSIFITIHDIQPRSGLPISFGHFGFGQ